MSQNFGLLVTKVQLKLVSTKKQELFITSKSKCQIVFSMTRSLTNSDLGFSLPLSLASVMVGIFLSQDLTLAD